MTVQGSVEIGVDGWLLPERYGRTPEISRLARGDIDRRNALDAVRNAAPDLLTACKAAVPDYEGMIGDHPELDPDGELRPRLEALQAAIAREGGRA
ncbi:MAG TPA: hypothetical protein VKD72_12725 [Gemmataceae bacterium]|nr:hypothetical protein [Gemmataceae bacterium]